MSWPGPDPAMLAGWGVCDPAPVGLGNLTVGEVGSITCHCCPANEVLDNGNSVGWMPWLFGLHLASGLEVEHPRLYSCDVLYHQTGKDLFFSNGQGSFDIGISASSTVFIVYSTAWQIN